MPKILAAALLCAMIPAMLQATDAKTDAAAAAAPAATAAVAANPLLDPWAGAYGGVPPFDQIKPELFPAALEAALAERRTEIAAIKNNPEKPT
ncbi:MAG TPA: M3 family peptidase, partial [Thermoanaerobaculia bacterium]|nr:M3 family peptidase [Thermoanaerobaculia bacterium]